MKFLRSVIAQDETPAADGVITYDLPVNPLSHIILTIKCLNVAAVEATIAQICTSITNIEVLHRGTSIIQMSAADLFALDHVLLGNAPVAFNMIATINGTRALSLIVPLGRRPYNPAECFPETKSGELKLRLTVDIAAAGYTGLILQIETIELLGASPARYLKATTLARTPSAVGFNDVDLPVGNLYAGILVWGTTIPATTLWTTTIDQVKLLADNTEVLYSLANWESLRGDMLSRIGHRPGYILASISDHIPNYALLDFSPNGDEFLLNTKGLSSLKLKITAGDVQPLRLIPLELPAAK